MDKSEYDRIYAHEKSHFWYRGLHSLVDRWIAKEIQRMQRVGSATILDCGCGTGGVLDLAARHATAYGFDFSPHALEFARRRGHTRLVRASIAAVPFRDATFDGAVSLDVLYHRSVPDDAAAVAEIARVVRPGGFIVLNLPAHDWLRGAHDVIIHTARRYTKKRVREIVESAGLEIARLSFFNCTLFPAVVAARMLFRRADDSHGASDVRPLPGVLNAFLTSVLRAEGRVIQHLPLPFGLSLFCVARKPAATA